MDKPDLAALATEANDIVARIDALRAQLDAGMNAALGEYDEDTDTETVPGNGDEFTLWENAKSKAGDGRVAIGVIVDILATQEGLRAFDAAGVTD